MFSSVTVCSESFNEADVIDDVTAVCFLCVRACHLSDGVFMTQTAVRSGTHINVGREVVTFSLQRRAVSHVEVETPEDGRTVSC